MALYLGTKNRKINTAFEVLPKLVNELPICKAFTDEHRLGISREEREIIVCHSSLAASRENRESTCNAIMNSNDIGAVMKNALNETVTKLKRRRTFYYQQIC